MTWAHLTLKSANAKTGPIPVSTTEPDSCPPSCPFRDAGCYAKNGPLALHWRKLGERDRGMPWSEFCIAIASLPAGQLWRLNQAGDLPGRGEEVNLSELRQLLRANKGKRGFSYSHKRSPEALAAIREANAEGLTVNLSGNSLADADALAETGAGPVVCVLPASQTTNTRTPAGRKVVVCPATQREGVSCATCQLCARGNRSVIVGFPAHGTGARKASAIAGGAS